MKIDNGSDVMNTNSHRVYQTGEGERSRERPRTSENQARSRLDFQPFCEPAFLALHHGWITVLPIVYLDQSEPSLLDSSRLGCDWSVLSLVYPTWRMSVLIVSSVTNAKCVSEGFHIDKFRETQQDAILNLLKGKDVLVSQPTA